MRLILLRSSYIITHVKCTVCCRVLYFCPVGTTSILASVRKELYAMFALHQIVSCRHKTSWIYPSFSPPGDTRTTCPKVRTAGSKEVGARTLLPQPFCLALTRKHESISQIRTEYVFNAKLCVWLWGHNRQLWRDKVSAHMQLRKEHGWCSRRKQDRIESQKDPHENQSWHLWISHFICWGLLHSTVKCGKQ